jgi:hypothetical protein
MTNHASLLMKPLLLLLPLLPPLLLPLLPPLLLPLLPLPLPAAALLPFNIQYQPLLKLHPSALQRKFVWVPGHLCICYPAPYAACSSINLEIDI